LARGGRADAEVWSDFSRDTPYLKQTVDAIRVAVAFGARSEAGNEEGLEEAIEGGVLTYIHRARERNRQLVRRKKEAVKRATGKLACEGCQFEFRLFYGERGANFIEVHHLLPLSSLLERSATLMRDLALVCANCHRMIHAKHPWLTMDALRAIAKPNAPT
jgi:5-methylcytosine-specific restriction protein A